MTYKGAFKDAVFPGPDREARVARYRLVLSESHGRITAGNQLRLETPPCRYQLASEREFDVVVNRIVNTELRGIRVDSLRLAVESDHSSIDYPLDFNAADLPARRSLIQPWVDAADLWSRDIVAGGVALFVDVDAGRPLEAWLVEVLRD
ncbi:hypothetical protein QCE47_27075 [Caballeronia sp. LZ025]|uniref:hypothetical protein n=1 Tax=Caballeronia TaxID=1827195 RepID=UPI001FD06C04|nr:MULTISPECIES: hypothetical protein [Caballeronia]MDR5735981.1 hypothetical protein [Caballeronia sp. LZ025]